MRTMTTINWVKVSLDTMGGQHLGTVHTGNRGSWAYQINTPKGKRPKLMASNTDGRKVSQEHRSLRAAKNAALDLLAPAEAMRWNADQGTGPIQYRAQWDELVFAVFANPEGDQFFQWRNTETGFRSVARPVSGIREARELAATTLRERFEGETTAEAPEAADGALIGRLANALASAGIQFTDEQLVKAADALV